MKKIIFFIVFMFLFNVSSVQAGFVDCSPGSGNEQACETGSSSARSSIAPENYSVPSAGNNQTQIVNVNVGSSGQPQQMQQPQQMMPVGGQSAGGGRQGRGGNEIGRFVTRLAEGFIAGKILGIPLTGLFNF